MKKKMNKTIKTLLELNGMMLATKAGIIMLPHSICGLILPQYMVASIALGIIASGYCRFKSVKNSKTKADKIISESDLFKLED